MDDFTSLAVAGRTIVHAEPAKEAQQMQQQFDVRVDAEAQAAGATPIRVRLPVNGKLFKLEKVPRPAERQALLRVEIQNATSWTAP